MAVNYTFNIRVDIYKQFLFTFPYCLEEIGVTSKVNINYFSMDAKIAYLSSYSSNGYCTFLYFFLAV
jgi:hypothetical protein